MLWSFVSNKHKFIIVGMDKMCKKDYVDIADFVKVVNVVECFEQCVSAL